MLGLHVTPNKGLLDFSVISVYFGPFLYSKHETNAHYEFTGVLLDN